MNLFFMFRFNNIVFVGLSLVIFGIVLTPFLIGIPLFVLGWLIIFYGIFKSWKNKWKKTINLLDRLGLVQLPEPARIKIKSFLLVLFVLGVIITLSLFLNRFN